jgi:hypothetical protein
LAEEPPTRAVARPQKVDHNVRLRSLAEILEDLREDVIAMGLLPAPIEAEPGIKG